MSESDSHVYAFGRFVLDADERLLLKDGVHVQLPPKAFDLLVVLVRNSGRLVRKEDLLEAVWPDVVIEEGNVSLNVYLVRRALGDNAGEPHFIETVPKQGYRFITPVRQLRQATEWIAVTPESGEKEDPAIGPSASGGSEAARVEAGTTLLSSQLAPPHPPGSGTPPLESATGIWRIAETLKTTIPPYIARMRAALERTVTPALAKGTGARSHKAGNLQGEPLKARNESATGAKNGATARTLRWVSIIIIAALCLLATLIFPRPRSGGEKRPAVGQGWQLQGDAPNRVIDLSETYGRVNMTVFNKKTRVVFANPHEFFQDSGVPSFDWPIKFDELTELPSHLRRTDGKELTPESKRAIETQPCPPEVCKR